MSISTSTYLEHRRNRLVCSSQAEDPTVSQSTLKLTSFMINSGIGQNVSYTVGDIA